MFNLGELYEFKEDCVLDNRVPIPKGTIVKAVDNGNNLVGVEFPMYSESFHNCAGNTKTGHGYYFGKNELEKLVRKVKTKKNNMEVYKNV